MNRKETLISKDGKNWKRRLICDVEFKRLPPAIWTERDGDLIRGDAEPEEVRKARLASLKQHAVRTR
jgi:hypothetical protein